jgi:signal transduction histidine kinase
MLQTWQERLRVLTPDPLGEEPLVLPAAAPPVPLTSEEMALRLTDLGSLQFSAAPAIDALAAWLGDIPYTCGVTDDEGVVLHAEASPHATAPRWVPGTRLFDDGAPRTALVAGRVVIFESPLEAAATILMPIRWSDAPVTGALALWCDLERAAATVAPALLQTVRYAAALAHLHDVRQSHDRVITMIGHELRQPLAALVTALDLVGRTSHIIALNPFRVAQRQALHLMRLVDGLLDASRLMTGKMRIARRFTDLRAIGAAAVESVRADAEAKSQRLDVSMPDRPVWCIADPSRLQQVAVNLLTNAHRYTPPRGVITMTVEDETDTVTMRVSDTGTGIEPEARDRIFQPFARSVSGSAEGLGVGLAISRGIVQLHGGTLRADSDGVGRGATFVVRLPGVLERTREVREAVMRTREETRELMQRAKVLREAMHRNGSDHS